MPEENLSVFIIKKSFELLKQKKGYSQRNIVSKLKMIEVSISNANFNNILSGKKVGQKTVLAVLEGMKKITGQELDYFYNEKSREFECQNSPGWVAKIIHEERNQKDANSFLIHEKGRLPLHEKTRFINRANIELIELGVRMKSFSDYFYFRNDSEYKEHIFALLEKGVNIKSYLIDPVSQQASLYFRDRASCIEEEMESPKVIEGVITRLKKLQQKIQDYNFPGKMEIYTYAHIPNNHYLIIDPESPHARMIVSHYLYGTTRANCPVFEFDKKDNRTLYRKYYNAFKNITAGAKKISG